MGHSGGEEGRVVQYTLIETVFSKESNTGVTFREGLGVESGSGGKSSFELGTNVLEGDNGGIRGRFGGKVMTKGFTVRCFKGGTQKSSLGEVAVGS